MTCSINTQYIFSILLGSHLPSAITQSCIRARLHQASVSMLRQLNHDASISVLIENNGVTPDWGCNPFSSNSFVTTRKQSLQRLCFYTCLSVILFTGGDVCLSACWDTHPPGQTPPLDRHPRADTPPAQCMLGDTGNKRAVRILLKCILVFNKSSANGT